MKVKELTLCMIHEGSRVLLGMKKRGFGAGRWNGFGGKLNDGETIESAALREIKEEVGIMATDISKIGLIDFEFMGDPTILRVHIFKVNGFTGEPAETEEMRPQWFHVDKIPFDSMWPDDKHWFPIFLSGKKFKGKFIFEGQSEIISHKLEEVNNI